MNRARTIKRFEISGMMTLLVILLISGVSLTAAAAQTPLEGGSGADASTEPQDSSTLLQKAEREGSVRVIVGLRTDFVPEGRLSQSQAVDQREAIGGAQGGLQAELQGSGYRTLREYETVPFIALELSPQALQAARRSARVESIVEDRPVPAVLADSTRIVQAPRMWARGLTGSGQVVAVLDTGVDRSHPFLDGKVVEEACFSARLNCPNGAATQTGAGSAVPCTYAASGCTHGTHVAGIAAGQGSSFSGVARGADLMAVQVFSRFAGATECPPPPREDPCTLSFPSDQMAGLERVFALRATHDFAAVNMSLGGGRFTSNCDTDPRKAIIDNLRSADIATVIASSNDGFTDAIGAPACISSAVSVGSTTKADTISSFSNSASFLSLLAPGSSINSSVPGGGFAVFSGTSMAAPHVAGAWALLKQQNPSDSVVAILSKLQNSGTSVTDTRAVGGATTPRINIADAAGIPRPLPGNCTIAGGPQGDVIVGTATRDVICGLGGNDTIRGLQGQDLLKGGPGNDLLDARDGRGGDVASGDAGRDRCLTDRGDRRISCELPRPRR